jgi:hypothetical protein
MSEYQYIGFRAIDSGVSEKNLQYMRQQSTRAEITPWSFENEYHYGDFHGNAVEMLRRGYDIHLHYANFGIRTLLIRLPCGLPDAKAAKAYLNGEWLRFRKDKRGHGGVLAIRPSHEPGDLDELWDLGELLDRLVPLRSEILDGDLRPLYLAHLAICSDMEHDPEETVEAPVPAGLQEPTHAQLALAELYGISESLIAAAAQESSPLPTVTDRRTRYAEWLAGQVGETKDVWLAELLADPRSSIRSEILAEFTEASQTERWPAVQADRTIAQLEAIAKEIHHKEQKRAADKAARQRAKLLKKMAADPTPYLRKTEKLVAERSTDSYRQAAEMLADLREALAGSKKSGLAEKQALKLKTKNPKLNRLTGALREQGFVPK